MNESGFVPPLVIIMPFRFVKQAKSHFGMIPLNNYFSNKSHGSSDLESQIHAPDLYARCPSSSVTKVVSRSDELLGLWNFQFIPHFFFENHNEKDSVFVCESADFIFECFLFQKILVIKLRVWGERIFPLICPIVLLWSFVLLITLQFLFTLLVLTLNLLFIFRNLLFDFIFLFGNILQVLIFLGFTFM